MATGCTPGLRRYLADKKATAPKMRVHITSDTTTKKM